MVVIKKVVLIRKDDMEFLSYSARYIEGAEIKEYYAERMVPRVGKKNLYDHISEWFLEGDGVDEVILGRTKTTNPREKDEEIYNHVKKAAEVIAKRRSCLVGDWTKNRFKPRVNRSKRNTRYPPKTF